MMVAMLFLHQGVMSYLPAAILTPPDVVIVGGYIVIWLLGAPFISKTNIEEDALEF